MEERKLPVGIQYFEKIRMEHYLYVDKTADIWDLANRGAMYFLSRPRRFGKSLLVSTLEAYFQGREDLFRGLDIWERENQKGENAWISYPIIHFSFAGGDFSQDKGLSDVLSAVLNCAKKKYGIDSVFGQTLPIQFKSLLENIYEKTGRQVVILVDEYDKPLLDVIDDPEMEEKNRKTYKSFFGILKDEDKHIRFVLFTGVTRFSKISIFSDLNQLNDISLSNRYAKLCGITEEELRTDFRPEIEKMAAELDISREECLEKLARMYDGYHFSRKGPGIYNPFSLLNAFYRCEFGSYWFATGTPTFLVKKLRDSSFTPESFVDGVEAGENTLQNYQADDPDPIPLFYQAGYLTITGYDRELDCYVLGFPNREVKYGFLDSLTPYVFGRKNAENSVSAKKPGLDLKKGDLSSFMSRLEALFAGIPYVEADDGLSYEAEWRNEIYLVLLLAGQNAECEVHSSKGRADCIVETDQYIYIFEFKLDKSADEALRQIEEKGYAKPYQADRRRIWKVGINFSSETRNISEWKTAG